MGIVGNYLWRLGSKIHLSPSKDESKKECTRNKKKGKGKKKKRKVEEERKKVDLSAIEMGEPSPLIQIEREIMEPHKAMIRQKLEAKVQEEIHRVESKGVPFCGCGGRGDYKGTTKGFVISRYGKVFIRYRRYRCPVCGKEMYPAIEQLGIVPRSWTPHVSALLMMLCVIVPFEQAVKLAKYLCNLEASGSGIWNLSQRTGEKLLAWEEKASEVYNNPHYKIEDKDGNTPEVIEMGVDGAMVLCRGKKDEASSESDCNEQDPVDPNASPCGKEVKSAESESDCDEQDPIDPKAPPCGKEVKSAVIFKPQDRVQLSKDRCALLERTVVAYRGCADAFFALLWASMAHCGLIGPETLVVIVADGAPWIWNRVSMFPNRVEILDFWHAAQHAWDCAKLLWPDSPTLIASWAKDIRKNIKQGKVAVVIGYLTELLENATQYKQYNFSQKAVKTLKRLIAYYTEHASRMDYPSYLSQGYSIGSGSVESLHKQVLHARMRGAGMRWSKRGASRMVALRARYINDRWNEVESFLNAA